MSGRRLIDRDERVRKKPMRVLVLGMCRTGTTTLSAAMRKLDFTTHQMRDILVKPTELALWQEAINVTLLPPQERPAKQRELLPYGKAEFDKLLGDYDAVMDLPGCVFAKELIKAYPDAKVILTTRNYKSWEHSMQESIWCLDTWSLFKLCRILNITHMAPLVRFVHTVFRVHNGNNYGGPSANDAYEKHYSEVRSLVPKEQLLEVGTIAELEWEPLCEFLGSNVPTSQFPRLNEEKALRENLESTWWSMVRYLVLMICLPSLVTIGAILLYMYMDNIRAYRDQWMIGPLKSYLEA